MDLAEKIARQTIVRKARKWTNTPFVHCGRNEFGLDCAGLLIVVAEEIFDIETNIPSYNQIVNGDFLKSTLDALLLPITKEELGIGDILLFAIRDSAQHLAIVTSITDFEHYSFIHSYQSVGKVVEQVSDNNWNRRIKGYYRFKQLEGE